MVFLDGGEYKVGAVGEIVIYDVSGSLIRRYTECNIK